MGDSLVVARAFQAGQIAAIYIGVHCGGNEVSDYVITTNYNIRPMKLNIGGGYLEVKDLYMGAHTANNPNYPDMDTDFDKSK